MTAELLYAHLPRDLLGTVKVKPLLVATLDHAEAGHMAMKALNIVVIGFLLCATDRFATSIYKCKTPRGVTFSEKPCAPDAEKIETKRSAPRQSFAAPSGKPLQMVAIEKFEEFGMFSTTDIIERVGRPAASYTHGDTEHWLYPNAIRQSDRGRYCPELLLRDDQKFQTNWAPEDVMKKSVAVARGFANWTQPSEVKEKRAGFLKDTAVVGKRKAGVVAKLGQPDGKRVYNGKEIWEYEKVRMASNKPDTVIIYIEFDGDVVTSSVGN